MSQAHVRNPDRESIIAAVREDDSVPVTDGGRFMVEYHPHIFLPGPRRGGCRVCPFGRRSPVHPLEVSR
jgi:hypothetical protein